MQRHTAANPGNPMMRSPAPRAGKGYVSSRLTPVARALALLLMAGGVVDAAHAGPAAFSSGWFGAMGSAQSQIRSSGMTPGGALAGIPTTARQQQQSRQELQQSLNNLNRTAAAIAAQQAAQAAARLAAMNAPSGVPDGLAEGGLKIDTDALTKGWINANAPTQSTSEGKTTVAIQQTADKAILNWETFNVGKNTTVRFGQQKDWAVLNRVNDPKARPSRIEGRIQADGTVLIINRNGIIFSGASQVNTRNLVAAATNMADAQFTANGIYSGTSASFTDAVGGIEVQAGAQIATAAPQTSTESGGYVLLLGQAVHNAGGIATPKGQTAMGGGDSFLIKKGVGTDGNQGSTTRGNEITPQFDTGSVAGTVVNDGVILAREGDVTLAGREVRQNGVALATTTVNTRGTVHLTALGADGNVALNPGAVTAVVIEDDGKTTALDSQREALRGPAVESPDNVVPVTDRRDQSRIEISSAGTVDFQGDSLTLATGGQIVVNAAGRGLVREGAQLDVSGAVGVNVAMASNNIKVNVQGNEQRDAPVNREGGSLTSDDVWIDRRSLVFVPKGTGGYDSDRWYTAGGLLEVSGYLGTQGHTAGEWMAQGGTVSFAGNDVVTQAGSHINLSGGTIDMQTGFLNQTWLKGADGRLYEVSKAPGDLRYTGLYKGFEDAHARWGSDATRYFYNPLIAPRTRLENGYTVGRDAGTLVIGTQSAVLEGDIISEVFQGARQTQAAQPELDGYDQSHNAAPRRGQLVIGQYLPMYDKGTGLLSYTLSAVMGEVQLQDTPERIAAGLDLGTALPAERQGKLVLDTAQLNGFELGSIRIAAQDRIEVDGDLRVAPGGNVTLYGNDVAVNANITAHSGAIHLGNVLSQASNNGDVDLLVNPSNPVGNVTVAQGKRLDASGLWSNVPLDPSDSGGLAYGDGGSISIRGSNDVILEPGSVIDVSSGAAVTAKGQRLGGKGGDVTVAANAGLSAGAGVLVLGGELHGEGVAGSGTLTLQANKVLIGATDNAQDVGTARDVGTASDGGTLQLGGDFFNKGFSAYDIIGNEGVIVADGAQVDVTMPVYRFGDQAQAVASGARPGDVLEVWTPPLYQEDPINGVLTQRRGASLSLTAGTTQSDPADTATTAVTVGQGSVITVDPGQSIDVRSIGQLTIDGTLNAWGGEVSLGSLALVPASAADAVNAVGSGRSIWLGDQAVIDVAARAASAVDQQGRTYGQVRDGGRIVIGGDIDPASGTATAADLFVVVNAGARLDASGAQASLDIPGQGRTLVASNGGSISLASNNGLYLDGSFVARAGASGAAGGRLSVVLQTPAYRTSLATDRVQQVRELVIGQTAQPSLLGGSPEAAADSLAYGHGGLGVDQVEAGGFDTLSLFSGGLLSFDGDVSLALGQSLSLYAGAIGLSEGASGNARIRVAAPYLRLAGAPPVTKDFYVTPSSTSLGYPSARPTEAVFSAAADLIDLQGSVVFSSMGTLTKADNTKTTIERRGFDDVQLVSQGDLRFLAGTGVTTNLPAGFTTQLVTQGDLLLSAAQLYPATGAGARVLAGYRFVGGSSQFDAQRTLTIGRTGTGAPQVPLSVFGRLDLEAATIEQGGVLRAPLGRIEIGTPYGTANVDLLPGSLTSVSGAGLIMPYGGTVDGQTYDYDGEPVGFLGQSGSAPNGLLTGVVILTGQSVRVLPDATLDLSGGGDLRGAGFVSGRGGSTDARYNPLVQIGADGTFKLPGLGTNPVYAIVPGAQAGYAPMGGEGGAVDPMIGQQITIGRGVPGLAAGTYTLMPSTYALLPGAFRVELNGLGGVGTVADSQQMRNGSWSTSGQLSIANTGIRNSVASQVILTPADVLRSYSQYNETSYAQFALADADRRGVPRPMLPVDAKTLQLNLVPGAGTSAFSFQGIGRFGAADGGYGGTVSVISTGSNGGIEVIAPDRQATADFAGVTVDAASLNALGAARLVIGGVLEVPYGQAGNYITFGNGSNTATTVVLREGATLSAPEVFLTSSKGDIVVEQGASINTLGRGNAAYDAEEGFIYQATNMLAVSNGLLNVLFKPSTDPAAANGRIRIGDCDTIVCAGQTALYSDGSIAAVTANSFELNDQVRYGTRHLTLALNNINVGSSQALADAAARGVLPAGLTLSQTLLERLLQGDTQSGAPALETLELSAHDAFNFYGSASLDTYDAQTGQSLLSNLMLTTPAIYGAGGADDVATIHTANLIWNGAADSPGAVIAGGAGTGSGRLDIVADTIEFGYGPFSQPGSASLGRLALGFANVNLNASERITSNHNGSLAVYQSQGAYDAASGFAYSGGNLNILTPLMTGEAGSVNHIVAGGAINVASTGAAPADAAGQGAALSLQGDSIILATSVVLPSGKLTLNAIHDVTLTDGALIDVAGRAIPFNDLTKYSWGGDVTLQSRNGNIRQAAGSRIDLSAQYNSAGQLSAVALDPAAGLVDLQGGILGGSSGYYDAGGTYMPYLAGGVEIQAQRLGATGSLDEQFAALNQRLNDGQMFGSRGFQLKQGNLSIGDGLKANSITVSLDNGSLLVNGTVDASGERVGNISLSAKNGLTVGGAALLDAHGSRLRVDSHGKIIDSPNRATVVLNSGDGQLTLSSGARIDLRHATDVAVGNLPGQYDGVARGTLELDAPRLGGVSAGDIAIDASGSLAIQGARSIAVNGAWRYSDAAYGTDPAASGRPYQIIDQAYLDAKNVESTAFINAALGNSDLMQRKLAGLNNATYIDVLHLRPGVEIVSATPDGDLVVQGDLDLSGYRYASINPHTQKTAVYGSGETGALTLRAGGDLSIYGSISDGFAPPPATQDDKGWQLLPGVDFTGGDIVVPGAGVTLADGTTFPAGTTLNYDLPIKGVTLAAGTRLPVAALLNQDLVLPAGTVLAAAIRDGAGNVLYAAGTLLGTAQTISAGSQLDAGSLLVSGTAVRDLTWPKGVPLPSVNGAGATTNLLSLSGSLALARGSLIPSGTDVKLPAGVDSVQLRPEVAGRQGELWAIAPMLADGSQSWSLRLVAGADTSAADSRVVQAFPDHGDLVLADSHYGTFGKLLPGGLVWSQEGIEATGDPTLEVGQSIDPEYVWLNFSYPSVEAFCSDIPEYCVQASANFGLVAGSIRPSVIRTGTGDLGLFSGGDVRMDSLFGVYTAGTSSAPTFPNDPYNQPKAFGANGTVLNDDNGSYENLVNGGADSVYRAWYPGAGGNLTLKVGGNLTGNIMDSSVSNAGRPNTTDIGYDTASVGNWLWRQGSGGVATGGQDQPTAWWINFGSYTAALDGKSADQMVGFTGFGTLGGGNLNVQVNGDAGLLTTPTTGTGINPRSQGLVLAVGSTGRVAADGSMQLTGGGDLTLHVGGALNPASTLISGHLNGVVADLRGNVQLDADTVGSLDLLYGNSSLTQSRGETRAYFAFASTRAVAAGGLTLLPGDATVSQRTLGDQVVQDVADPGRASLMNRSSFTSGTGAVGIGSSWFSLWTDHTAIDLFSAGGNLTPLTAGPLTDLAVVYPSILRAVAASGSLYYGDASMRSSTPGVIPRQALVLAPSDDAQLQFLAADSIYGGDMSVSQSGAAPASLATPQRPGFIATENGGLERILASNLATNGSQASASVFPLFAFGPDSASGAWAGTAGPARFYALAGDLLGVNSGRIVTFKAVIDVRAGQSWYEGGGPVWMMAGRDIVSSGTPLGVDGNFNNGGGGLGNYTSTGNLIVQNDPNDISIVSAGRDILYSNFNVAGPGMLEISAGRNILMEDKASVTSLGPVVAGDNRPGASIVMQAGVGASGPDYIDFVKAYLDPANLAQAGLPLADQAGKVVKTYDEELVAWLDDRYGFSGSTDEALAYYAALPAEQQRIFARDVYFAELKAGGREYNDADGPRQGSYLRGREAIAALFPDQDAAGNTITYKGDITLYGGAGVHTNFGGDIQMLTPGGGQTFGIEGNAPPSTAGIITQGEGNIQLYSQDSILLGQSRIMTTFGGSILAWSAQGDINAGRGSKTTIVYTPPKRVYDQWGNVKLSPDVPSTGAGIATLDPIPEVPPGDIDLIAPLGTIDAGEAGIRVSGNVNLAALQVVNAANIVVKGESAGIPVVASVNTSALTSASAAASSAANAAQDMTRQQQAAARQALPSIITVQVLGFGGESLDTPAGGVNSNGGGRSGAVQPGGDQVRYDPAGSVRVLGAGTLTQKDAQPLTDAERSNLRM